MPGWYRLASYGGAVAASISTPVEVRANATTEVSLALQAGIPRRFEFGFPTPLTESRQVRTELRTAAARELVMVRTAFGNVDRPAALACALLPGEYVLTARCDGLSARRTFTVPAGGEPSTLRLALQ